MNAVTFVGKKLTEASLDAEIMVRASFRASRVTASTPSPPRSNWLRLRERTSRKIRSDRVRYSRLSSSFGLFRQDRQNWR